MKKIILIGLLLLVGAGCASAPPSTHEAAAPSPHAGMHESSDGEGSVPADDRVTVLSDLSNKDAAQELRFRLFDAAGAELKPRDLKIAHEKLLHLIVIRDDYEEFHHVHPAYLDGEWRVKIAIETEGIYQAYFDIAPTEGGPVVLREELKIGSGEARPVRLVGKDIAASGAYEAEVRPVFEDDGMTYVFALRKNGIQVQDVSPYLGAYGHVVMLKSKEPDSYVHMHPITTTLPDDGIVRFGSPRVPPGVYQMYAQFSVGGEILTFPFVLTFGS